MLLNGQKTGHHELPGSLPALTSPPLALTSEFTFIFCLSALSEKLDWWQLQLIPSLGGMATVLLVSAEPIFLMADDSPIKRYKEISGVVHTPRAM